MLTDEYEGRQVVTDKRTRYKYEILKIVPILHIFSHITSDESSLTRYTRAESGKITGEVKILVY